MGDLPVHTLRSRLAPCLGDLAALVVILSAQAARADDQERAATVGRACWTTVGVGLDDAVVYASDGQTYSAPAAVINRLRLATRQCGSIDGRHHIVRLDPPA